MPSDIRALLSAASRPFVSFTATINEQYFNLLARKLSLADQEFVSNSWDTTYEDTKSKYQDKDESTSVIFSTINKLSVIQLSKYIADSDRNDLLAEALAIHDEKTKEDPEVIAELNNLLANRRTELESLPIEELKKLAGDRRVHFYALFKANESSSRLMASLMIYDTEKVLLFGTPELSVDDLTIDDLTILIEAASKALVGLTVNPLV